MTRKALGRGLNALFSSGPAVVEPGDVLIEVDVDLLDPNPAQPRTIFRDEKIEDLATSIRANGIVQPLLVRRQGERFQIIAGERRWRAAQRAGLETVPIVVRDIPDERVLELSLIENIQREELNPIEEAHAYRRLIDGLGVTHEEVARRIGRERSSVTNYLRLLNLPPEVQQWVEEDKLTMGHARALLPLETPDAQRQFALKVIDNKLSVREIEDYVKKIREQTARKRSGGRGDGAMDANVRAAEDRLSRRLGTKVRLQTLKQGGKIEIYYSSNDDLDRIYTMIAGA